MSASLRAIDTNVILRYLLDDEHVQAGSAALLIDSDEPLIVFADTETRP